MRSLRLFCLSLSLAYCLTPPSSSSSVLASGNCPFGRCCFSTSPTTLVQDIAQANMVLFGTIENSQLGQDGMTGTTDLRMETAIKDHESRRGRQVLRMQRYIPPATNQAKVKWLIFFDVDKGQLDAYRGLCVRADSDLVKYLQGAMEIQRQPISQQLKYYFRYLDNPEPDIAIDAYKAFDFANYKDYRRMAADLPPDKIARWLLDPATPFYKHGLYGLLLGHCGRAKDADVLLGILRPIEKPENVQSSRVDGILTGYILLRPKEGWNELTRIINDPKLDFFVRYAALRAMRFLWDNRPDVVAQAALVQGLFTLLEQDDIADIAIEDLRRWKRWEACDRILDLQSRKSHQVPYMQRSILRYALSCPAPRAVAFVAECRKRDPEKVKEAEVLLREEGKE